MSRGQKEPQPGLTLSDEFPSTIACFSSQSLSFGEEVGGGFPITLFAKFAAQLAEDSVKESSTILTVSNALSSQEITLQVKKSW